MQSRDGLTQTRVRTTSGKGNKAFPGLQGAPCFPGTPDQVFPRSAFLLGDLRRVKTLRTLSVCWRSLVLSDSILSSEVFVIILKGNGNFADETDVSFYRELLKRPDCLSPRTGCCLPLAHCDVCMGKGPSHRPGCAAPAGAAGRVLACAGEEPALGGGSPAPEAPRRSRAGTAMGEGAALGPRDPSQALPSTSL